MRTPAALVALTGVLSGTSWLAAASNASSLFMTVTVYLPASALPMRNRTAVGVVLPSGMKSSAPCTVQKSPVPSAATVSLAVPADGAALLVVNRHAAGWSMTT